MTPMVGSRRGAFALSLSALLTTVAADPTVLPAPGQPTKTGTPGTFEIVGTSGVSAQQLFLGQSNRVYIIDKTENNVAKVRKPLIRYINLLTISGCIGWKPLTSCLGDRV